MAANKEPNCSFCGRKKNEVELLLSGTDGQICNLCIEQGYELIQQELHGVIESKSNKKKKKGETPKFDIKPPIELKKYLDKFIIGQDEAKKVLGFFNTVHDSGEQTQAEPADQTRATGTDGKPNLTLHRGGLGESRVGYHSRFLNIEI